MTSAVSPCGLVEASLCYRPEVPLIATSPMLRASKQLGDAAVSLDSGTNGSTERKAHCVSYLFSR